MLSIMPWCRIDRAYEVGDVTIVPYFAPREAADDAVQRQLARVLATKGGLDEVARVALGMMVQIRLARGCFA